MSWYITDTAAKRYAQLCGIGSVDSARDQLAMRVHDAHLVKRDSARREMWRVPPASEGLRVVVERERVIWCGQGRPPARLWTPDDEPAPMPVDPQAKRSRGRPPTVEGPREHQVGTRLNDSELAALQRIQARLGDVDQTVAVRAAILAMDER